jgi:hypothetical protein
MNHLKKFESFNNVDFLIDNIKDILLELDDGGYLTAVDKKHDYLDRITIHISSKSGDIFSINDISEEIIRINDFIVADECVIKNIYLRLKGGDNRFLNIKKIEEFPEWEVMSISIQFIPN